MDVFISVLSVLLFTIIGLAGLLLFFGNYIAKLIGTACFGILAVAFYCGQTAAVPIALGLGCCCVLLAIIACSSST